MVGWFEIPVLNLERAKQFYDKVFDITITVHDFGGLPMGWFPYDPEKKGAPGTLIQHDMYTPSATKGTLIYFSCKNLVNELSRVEAAGGTILKPKTQIGVGHGFMALFIDSEGNRIALHSNQ